MSMIIIFGSFTASAIMTKLGFSWAQLTKTQNEVYLHDLLENKVQILNVILASKTYIYISLSSLFSYSFQPKFLTNALTQEDPL